MGCPRRITNGLETGVIHLDTKYQSNYLFQLQATGTNNAPCMTVQFGKCRARQSMGVTNMMVRLSFSAYMEY